MKQFSLARLSRHGAVLLPAAAAMLFLSLSSSAQEVRFESTEAVLKTEVHLRLGSTTLKQTLKTLSDQTGLTIRPAEYLEDRVMIVQMENLTARQALETLAECHDWVWREKEKGTFIVERPALKMPASLLEVSSAFARVVPLDVRRYIGKDVSESELHAIHSLRHPELQPKIIAMGRRESIMQERLIFAKDKAQKAFQASVTPEMTSGKKILFTELTPEQKQNLLTKFVFDALYDVCTLGSSYAPSLIYGNLNPDRLDENKMLLHWDGGGLDVGTILDGHFSFAEEIVSFEQLPDPLRKLQRY